MSALTEPHDDDEHDDDEWQDEWDDWGALAVIERADRADRQWTRWVGQLLAVGLLLPAVLALLVVVMIWIF